jgi:hypothetical protein
MMQKLFNQNRPELMMVESRVIGTRVDPGQVRLIHLNNVPGLMLLLKRSLNLCVLRTLFPSKQQTNNKTELVTCFDGPREFRPGKGLDVRDELGIFKESDLFYGAKVTREKKNQEKIVLLVRFVKHLFF